jgi:UDP-N-acetylmuramoyl-tripeptide--D-alanyl-D-alanine ligase
LRELSFEEVLEATGGRLLQGKPGGVKGISIDSRTIEKGQFFVAIKGERFDGHNFVEEALSKGSGAFVSVPPLSPHPERTVIYVDNTLKALHGIARYIRLKSGIPVVGITGTNGKTTTKEMAASILGIGMKVLKNTGNLNNQIGLPLSLLGLTGEHQVAVLEMGASAPGDIRELCEVASPDYGVLTNIGFAHIEGFKDIDTVRQSKLELLGSVRAAAVNADDSFLMDGLSGYGGELLRYGIKSSVDVYATDIEYGERQCDFVLHMKGESVQVNLRVTGTINIYNALAAASVGAMFGIGAGDIKKGLEMFEGVPMRLEIRELDGAIVISDVYNANPASMEEALKELIRLRRNRAVAVLGDMLELGAYSEAAHRRLGAWMARFQIDLLIAVGHYMGMAAEEFMRSGKGAVTVADSLEARKTLLEEYKKGDTILIKGSRGMKMERVIESVSGDKARAGGQR